MMLQKKLARSLMTQHNGDVASAQQGAVAHAQQPDRQKAEAERAAEDLMVRLLTVIHVHSCFSLGRAKIRDGWIYIHGYISRIYIRYISDILSAKYPKYQAKCRRIVTALLLLHAQ